MWRRRGRVLHDDRRLRTSRNPRDPGSALVRSVVRIHGSFTRRYFLWKLRDHRRVSEPAIRTVLLGGSADDGGAGLFGHDETFVAGHAGISTESGTTRLTIFAEGGWHSYSDLGRGFLAESTSMPAHLAFLGARSVVDLALGSRRTWLLGWWLAYRTDLGTTTPEVSRSCSGGCGSWKVGGMTIATGLHVGFEILP